MKTTSPSPYGRPHARLRARLIAAMSEGTPCPFCRKPMFSSPAAALAYRAPAWMGQLELDHAIPVALGGAEGPKRLTHRSCNQKAGASLGGKRVHVLGRASKRRPPRRRLPRW